MINFKRFIIMLSIALMFIVIGFVGMFLLPATMPNYAVFSFITLLFSVLGIALFVILMIVLFLSFIIK